MFVSWLGYCATDAATGIGAPPFPRGVTLIHPDRAHRFFSRDEAEETAARLNGTAIHGGEVVYDDGWTVVEV